MGKKKKKRIEWRRGETVQVHTPQFDGWTIGMIEENVRQGDAYLLVSWLPPDPFFHPGRVRVYFSYIHRSAWGEALRKVA